MCILWLSIYIELLLWNPAVEIAIDQEGLRVAASDYSCEDLPGQDQYDPKNGNCTHACMCR